MAPRCCCCRRAHPCPELGARCAAALLHDFRQIELLWTLLVGAIAISVLAVDNMTAASTLSLSNVGQVSAVSGATLLRIRVALEPMPAALRTTQASLSFIPWPWGLGTWTQLAAPVMAASSSAEITGCVLAELVPGADRASWEAQMTAMYNRTARVLEFSTTSEPRAVRRRSCSNDARARARAGNGGSDVAATRAAYMVRPCARALRASLSQNHTRVGADAGAHSPSRTR
jgi:hypothetical protein